MRIALIKNGMIDRVVIAPADYVPPPEFTAMTEAAALVQGIAYAPPVPPQIPDEVTPRQFRRALSDINITPEMVEALIAGVPDEKERRDAMIDWDTASSVRRTHPLVLSMGAALGMDAAGVNGIFLAASQIPG